MSHGEEPGMKQLGIFDEMDRIGPMLKEARERLKLSLEDVHEETRITIQHLQYLEDSNFRFLPETYVKSFLKTYAERLGLDSEALLKEYKSATQPATSNAASDEQGTTSLQASGQAAGETGVRGTELAKRRTGIAVAKNKHVEALLFFGTLVLLAAIIVSYFWYQSEIHALRQARSATSVQETALAEIKMNDYRGQGGGGRFQQLQLQVTAREALGLWLKIDSTQVVERNLLANENVTLNGDSSFEIMLKKTVRRVVAFGSERHDATEEVVRLTLTKEQNPKVQN